MIDHRNDRTNLNAVEMSMFCFVSLKIALPPIKQLKGFSTLLNLSLCLVQEND